MMMMMMIIYYLKLESHVRLSATLTACSLQASRYLPGGVGSWNRLTSGAGGVEKGKGYNPMRAANAIPSQSCVF